MTRKKYDRDYEGEAINEVYGKGDESSDDGEEDEEEPYDPWEELDTFIHQEIRHIYSASWISKWFDATDIMELSQAKTDMEAIYKIKNYLFPFETAEDVNILLDLVWYMLEICRIEPRGPQLYTVALELLAERTKWYYVNNKVKHRSIVNKRFFN